MASIPQKNNSSNQAGENYSVDKMMARLKKGEQEKRQPNQQPEGELITREDGTQVMKVKRRKRRSKQQPSKNSSKTNPKLKWAILGSIVGLLVILVVGTIFIIAKYNGRKFKTTTESTITALTGSTQTTLTQLRVTPVSTQASKTEIIWDKHSFLKDATFTKIRANIKITSFFSSDWIGEEVVASKGKIHLQTPKSISENTLDDIISPYQFDAFRCNQLDLIFGSQRTSPSITDLQVSLRKLQNDQPQIVFHNGIMNVAGWPKMKLSSGIITLNSLSANIEALLKADNSHNGELTIKGSISKTTDATASLAVKAKSFPIQELLGKDLGRLIKGELQGDNGVITYDYNKDPDQALSFILPFNSTDIRCEGFPMFKVLNNLIGDTAYNRPSFPRCRGTIIRTSEGLSLNNLEFINNSLMLIHGNIAVSAKGKLSGKLSVGIPESVFDDNVPKPFSGPRGGFYHIDVTLSGTIQTPNDNLHALLKNSRPAQKRPPIITPKDFIQSPPNQQKTSTKPAEADFNELTR